MDTLDFESVADAAAQPEGMGLEKLKTLVKEIEELESNIEQLEELLKSAKGRYNALKTEIIPSIFSELQTDEWVSEDGIKIKMGDFVSGNIPKEEPKRQEAISYLESLPNGADLFKTTVSIEFPKRGHNEALAVADDLRKHGYTPLVESGVHVQTLWANIMERFRRGENVDLDKLGLFIGRVAKVSRVKEKKGKKNDK